MTRKTTHKQAKTSRKGGDVAPAAAGRSESTVEVAEMSRGSEAQNPEWWRNEGGSGEVQ
ncbi:MAG: hypothetical protein WC538_00975 [Thermoanaerobaculia bacterium]|jgi:hypothetical protein